MTLGLEMRWIGYTNDLVLHRFDILQRVYENGLKTRLLILRNCYEKEINFYLNFASSFRGAWLITENVDSSFL